jgi:hypothetical protein
VANLGHRWAQSGNLHGAVAAYRIAADSRDPHVGVTAALHLWVLYLKLGDRRRSRAAYREAVRRQAQQNGTSVGEASLKIGSTMGADYSWLPAWAEARVAYWDTVESGDPEAGPMAAVGLGMMLWGLPEYLDEIQVAFRRAIESRHPECAPAAALWLGILCRRTGDVTGARASLQLAVDSRHAELAREAAFYLANLDEG